MNPRELLKRLYRRSTSNVKFSEFQKLVEAFGFSLRRVSGSHHLFKHPKVPGFLNLQPKNGEVAAYQVGQFLKLIEKYNLHLED